jgi:hypothetical protein
VRLEVKVLCIIIFDEIRELELENRGFMRSDFRVKPRSAPGSMNLASQPAKEVQRIHYYSKGDIVLYSNNSQLSLVSSRCSVGSIRCVGSHSTEHKNEGIGCLARGSNASPAARPYCQ